MAYASRFLSRSKQQQHAIPVPAFAKEAARPTFKGDDVEPFLFIQSGTGKVVDCLKIANALEAQNIPAAQAEALTVAITGALDSVMEKLEEDIATSTGQQSTLVTQEVQKIRDDIDIMKHSVALIRAEQRYDVDKSLHNLEQKVIKGPSDLRSEFNMLKADFESRKYVAVKFAIVTLASMAAAGLGMLCLM